jgi:hypothetical protein
VKINWDALLNVAFVSFGIAVGVVVLSAFAMVGLSARATGAAAAGDSGMDESEQGSVLSPTAGTVVAGLCLLAVAAIVAYGLWIIIN